MCGLAGFVLRPGQQSAGQMTAQAQAMADSLIHRGPDDGGVWVDAAAGVALAHRRLAIMDLSPLGHQPMASSCGRFQLVFNGEIFNAEELRPALLQAGRSFRGHSDTEVMAEGFAVWGIPATLEKLTGMFAIAVWDRAEQILWLARDRLGIKPLYWGQGESGLILFGSELKALRACAGWTPRLNRAALALYLRHNYIPAPHSIYQNIYKLPPGHLLRLPLSGGPDVALAEPQPFWSLQQVIRDGLTTRQALAGADDQTILDRLDAELRRAIGLRMVADVPLGAFLSGGIDSSAVVALMQAQSDRPVKTYSIGFQNAGYDEARHAAAVARHLGTDHSELYVQPSDALDVIPSLAHWYDEPFGDSSQIPTYLMCKMARQHVTVALSGDGGDELFAGYSRYPLTESLDRMMGRIPAPLRQAGAGLVRMFPPAGWNQLGQIVPAARRPEHLGHRLHKLADWLSGSRSALYGQVISQWADPLALLDPAPPQMPPSLADCRLPDGWGGSLRDQMQYSDTLAYLPDDVLTKVDRASMAVALEARVPLLDHHLLAYAWTLPERFKVRDGKGKWALRQVLYRYVPPALIDRPKMGFGVPLGDWLRGPLRDWAEDLLREGALRQSGFAVAPLRRAWGEQLSGARNWQYPLWTVLMAQDWLRRSGVS